MKAALRWMAGNVPLMILALILSIISWFVAIEAEDPTITGRYTEPIPVVITGQPDGTILMSVSSREMRVNLRATESVWADMTPGDFHATADLTGLGAGTHQVPIDVRLDEEPADILAIEPQAIQVVIDYRREKTVPVRLEVSGSVDREYLPGTPSVSPTEITVSGPATSVDRAAEALVEVSIEGQTTDVQGSYLVRLLDDSGESVSGVTMAPDSVSVNVPIELSGYYRFLDVRVVIEGEVAENYRISEIIVDPKSVTVFGSPSDIASLPGFIETSPISVSGATDDVIELPSLILPDRVTLASEEKPVEVTVAVDPVQGSRTVNITPTIQGLEPGYTATIPLDSVAVVLSGPLPVLEALEPGDVRVQLDLFRLDVGTHEVELRAIVPVGVSAQSIFPAIVQIEVSLAPTPTPTPAPVEGG